MRMVRRGRLFMQAEIEDLTVVALSDGYADMPVTRLQGADDLTGVPLHGGNLRLSVYAFFVRGPGGAMMIDAGAGDAWKATTGRLPEAMAEAGIDPDEVGQVALTHTHVDHIGGLVAPDKMRTFPRAERIWVPSEELGLFRAEGRMAPVLGLMLPLEQGDGPMPGVVAINAPGHEAGHMAFLIENRLLIWGDVVHVPGVQFRQPEVTWDYDSDPVMARATRLRLMGKAADEGLMVAGAHLDFPAVGRVFRAGGAFGYDALGDL